jgi:hypothetical protein
MRQKTSFLSLINVLILLTTNEQSKAVAGRNAFAFKQLAGVQAEQND